MEAADQGRKWGRVTGVPLLHPLHNQPAGDIASVTSIITVKSHCTIWRKNISNNILIILVVEFLCNIVMKHFNVFTHDMQYSIQLCKTVVKFIV